MLGFLNRMQSIEERLDRLSQEQIGHWLMIINSDILSAIEKRSPVVSLKSTPESAVTVDFTIRRSERGVEGEYLHSSSMPHIVKWRNRIEFLEKL